MQTNLHRLRKSTPLLAVTAPEDIEFLVKESEVLTGRPGRIFVIAGADRLRYRVRWQLMGFKVERLDAQGEAMDTQHLLPWEFIDHSLVEALGAGQLFTPSVSRSS
ncbi:MAG: hypothetical protein ABI605_20230 [Rhizobacter sp.]